MVKPPCVVTKVASDNSAVTQAWRQAATMGDGPGLVATFATRGDFFGVTELHAHVGEKGEAKEGTGSGRLDSLNT